MEQSRTEVIQDLLFLPILAWFGALACAVAALVWTATKLTRLLWSNGDNETPFAISGT